MRRRRFSPVVGLGYKSLDDNKIFFVRCSRCGEKVKKTRKQIRGIRKSWHGFLCPDCDKLRRDKAKEKRKILREIRKEAKEERRDRAKRDKMIQEKGLDYVLDKDKNNATLQD